MKVYGGLAVKLHSFLISSLEGVSESSGLRPGHFTTREIVRGAQPV